MFSAALSYRDMLKAGSAAEQKLSEIGLGDNPAVWISQETYQQCQATSGRDELETQVFERLLKAGLGTEPLPPPTRR